MKSFRERGFNDDLDIDTLLTVLFNRLSYLITVFIGSIALLILIYLFQERIYQSSAMLQFETKSSTLVSTPLDGFTQNNTALTAEKEIFRSLNTIEGVKTKILNKSKDVEIPDSATILKGISFSDDGKNLLTINFSINDNKISKIVLQSLIEEFISDRIQNNRIAAIKGIEFVDEEIPKLKNLLNLAENDLTRFRSSGGNSFIFDNENRGDVIDSLNKEIKDIELKEIELKEFYKSNHPIYSTLIEQKNILLDELEELETGIKDLPSEQRKLFNLTQRVNIYSSSLEELEKQKLSLNLIAASSTSNVRIINNPSEPIKISPKITLLLISFLFLFIAYFIFLLDHFFTDKIMSLDALLDYLEDRNLLIGAFPYINKSKKRQRILLDIENNFTDRIIVNLLNSDKKVFLVSSMKEGVGKSYFSERISHKLSNFSEKVCLLDLDMRKKGISNTSEKFKNHGIEIEKFLVNDGNENGITYIKKPDTDDPISYLKSDSIKKLIDKLKLEFDKVIIDSPPMGTFIDAKIISEYTDQIICILSSHESSFSEISSISKELSSNPSRNDEILYFLNKVRYFLEIFWFNVRYPIYGAYNYYNPYSYYSNESSKGFRKFKKYVSFGLNLLGESLLKLKKVLDRFFKRK